MVTNIERSGGQEAFFNGVGDLEDIFFVFSPVATHETYRAYQGPKIIAHRYQEVVQWLGMDTGALSGGPLVGNFAFSIAEHLGCDPIILVGMELSFPSAGATHVEGMVFGVQDSYRRNMIEVEGNHGEILLTNRYFEESRQSLEMQIEKFGGLCLNATPGGARIRGSILMDLKNALYRYCPHLSDFKKDLYNIWEKDRKNRPDMEEEMNRVISVLDWTVSELQSSLDACRKGIDVIDRIEKHHTLLIGREPNPDALTKVKDAESELFQLRAKFISQPGLKFLSYIFSGYHNDYAMRRSSLFDQYHDRDFARLKAFLNDREYFKTMGQLIVSTIYAIDRAKTDLEEERFLSSSSSITDTPAEDLMPIRERTSKDPFYFAPLKVDIESS
jgi:hypothetical protein